MIKIRCIRSTHYSTAKANASRDDCITIKPATAGKFTLSYTYGCTAVKQPTVATLDEHRLWRYVRALLRNLEADTDPFEFLQLELPLMPTFMYRVDNLSSNYNDILNAVELQLDVWTSAVADDDAESLTEDAEEVDDEDEYADMPLLQQQQKNDHNYHNHRHLFFDEDGDVAMAYD